MFIPIPLLIVALAVGLFIFGLMRTRRRLPPAPDAMPRPRGSGPDGQFTAAEVETQARLLVQQDRKIEAVALVREETGMALKDAKDFVERL